MTFHVSKQDIAIKKLRQRRTIESARHFGIQVRKRATYLREKALSQTVQGYGRSRVSDRHTCVSKSKRLKLKHGAVQGTVRLTRTFMAFEVFCFGEAASTHRTLSQDHDCGGPVAVCGGSNRVEDVPQDGRACVGEVERGSAGKVGGRLRYGGGRTDSGGTSSKREHSPSGVCSDGQGSWVPGFPTGCSTGDGNANMRHVYPYLGGQANN